MEFTCTNFVEFSPSDILCFGWQTERTMSPLCLICSSASYQNSHEYFHLFLQTNLFEKRLLTTVGLLIEQDDLDVKHYLHHWPKYRTMKIPKRKELLVTFWIDFNWKQQIFEFECWSRELIEYWYISAESNPLLYLWVRWQSW